MTDLILSWEYLGSLLRDLREERDISQARVVAALPFGYSTRSLARVESGERRPSRHTLIGIAIYGLKLAAANNINELLEAAEYIALTAEEIRQHKLMLPNPDCNVSSPEPQKTTWGPTIGKPPGISAEGASGH